MNTFIIPVSNTTDPFNLQVELDGSVFELFFWFNVRGNYWSLDLSRDGVILVYGIKLVVISNLLSQYRRIANMPEGILFVDDLGGLDNDPDDSNFGDRVVLKYTDTL